jgi:hypothetical protein
MWASNLVVEFFQNPTDHLFHTRVTDWNGLVCDCWADMFGDITAIQQTYGASVLVSRNGACLNHHLVAGLQ